MANYFSSLPHRLKVQELGKCDFMASSEFADGVKKLIGKKIVIIGCGGLGSSLAYALGSSGIGEIHLVDFDTVSVHNIHRQIAFKLGDEGKFKADVVKESIESRCPFVKVHTHIGRLEDFTCKEIEEAITQMNAKVAAKNIAVLHQGINDAKANV